MWSVLLLTVLAQAPAEGCAQGACHAGTATAPAHRALGPKHVLACSACHRGDPAARDATSAHRVGGQKELLAGPLTQAGCGVCHLAGGKAGTELLAKGSGKYLELACGFCHPLFTTTAGPAPLGPPIAPAALRGKAYLSQVLRAPSKQFPGSPMPAYGPLLDAEPETEQALLAYLLSLTAPRPPAPAAAGQPCGACHTGPARPKGAGHRCAFIAAERQDLRCGRCHGKKLPGGPERDCLYIGQRRRECAVCHDGALDGPGTP